MLKNELKIFFTAVMFYTRIPCPKWVEHSPVYLNKTSRYFPLIGWITGTVFFISLYLSLLIFVSAHSVSRLAAISIVFTHQYVREDMESKAKPIAQSYTWKEVIGSFFFGLLPLIYLSFHQYQIIYTLIPLLFARFMLSRYFKKWIGGYTGDCLGATQQVCEVVFYLTVIAIWKFI